MTRKIVQNVTKNSKMSQKCHKSHKNPNTLQHFASPSPSPSPSSPLSFSSSTHSLSSHRSTGHILISPCTARTRRTPTRRCPSPSSDSSVGPSCISIYVCVCVCVCVCLCVCVCACVRVLCRCKRDLVWSQKRPSKVSKETCLRALVIENDPDRGKRDLI